MACRASLGKLSSGLFCDFLADTRSQGIKKANNVPHDAEIFERVCDIHRIVLGLICPSCYETLAPSTSKEPNLLNDIAESIHAYQGTSEVKGFFAFTFGLDPETESPYLILEIAERMEDEKLRDRAMPHAIGQWFQETRPDMSESIRRIVSAEAEAFQRLLQKIVQEIEEILARPSTVSSIIAAHLIRKFVFVNSGSIYGLAHPVREASYQVLLLLYGTQSADAFWADHEIIALEHNERLATKLGRHGTRRDVKVSVYKVQKKVSGMLNEIQRALQPVFKEDQGLGYFTPPCHFFRWLDADLNNYASGTDDYGDDEHDTASGTEDVGMEWDSDRYDGMDDDVGEVTDTDTTWETEEDEEDEYTDAGSLSVQPSDQEIEKAARSWATKKACAPQQLALRLRATLPQSSS